MVEKNDWRLTNQENYLKAKKLFHTHYRTTGSFDHDHCDFCFKTFYATDQIGFCTTDYYYWICEQCFKDFAVLFKWELVDEEIASHLE